MTTPASALSDCSVVVVGDVILDVYFMGDVRRVSPEAPVPLVRVCQKTTTLGGAGNVALNVVGLKSRASLIGIRGPDEAGARVAELLRRHGIWDGLVVDADRATTSKTRVIGHGQHLIRLDEEDTRPGSSAVREALIGRFLERLPGADVVILSDYAKGVLDPDTIREIVRCCRAAGVPVLVDPRGRDWSPYQGVTCITPNTNELEIASGLNLDDEGLLVSTASQLRQRCEAEWLLVTRGAKGMCLVAGSGPALFISATAREVFDVSGAGDTVIATFAVAIASGLPVPDAAALSNAAAGIVVGKLGSQPIRLAELEGALRIDGLGARAAGMGKITTVDAAQAQIKAWQGAGDRVVFVTGAFDRLAPGHVHLLRHAKDLGERLAVGLLGDDEIRDARGPGHPGLPAHDRAYLLSALGCTDLVVLIDRQTTEALVADLCPDIVVRQLSGAAAEPSAATFATAELRYVRGLEGFDDV